MNWKAVPRKRRKHPVILKSAPLFEEALYNKDYDKAAKIVVSCALQVLGVKGLMNSFERTNSFLNRLKYRDDK